jgi:hypothetical protein
MRFVVGSGFLAVFPPHPLVTHLPFVLAAAALSRNPTSNGKPGMPEPKAQNPNPCPRRRPNAEAAACLEVPPRSACLVNGQQIMASKQRANRRVAGQVQNCGRDRDSLP